MLVALSSFSAVKDPFPLACSDHINDHEPGGSFAHGSADRHSDDQVIALFTEAVGRPAVLTVLGGKFTMVFKIG